MSRDFDSPWKETLVLFLQPILRMFFPDIHAAIDWSRGYEVLDTELQAIVREAELGSTLADKLFKAYLCDGTDVWILIHLEVQAQPDPDFARRMFVYHYRIRDRYDRDVASLAILGDERPSWRPKEYQWQSFGCEIVFRFRTVKLLDWSDRQEELAADPSPIGPIVLAHLQSLATRGDPEERLRAKWRLIRSLYDRGLDAEGVWLLYRLIDWFLELPAELEVRLKSEVIRFEEERRMLYTTSMERLGIEKGQQQMLAEVLPITLEAKFGEQGLAFARELQSVKDFAKLRAVLDAVRTAKNIDELRKSVE